MNDKSYIVFPLKRILATVYDLFLLLGVWFGVGSLALWINGGEILNPWIGLSLVFLSTWGFYSFFWIHGGKTLGMAVWKFEIYSLNSRKVTIYQTSIRLILNLITFLLAGLPLLLIYFSNENLSLSDMVSKTSYRKI